MTVRADVGLVVVSDWEAFAPSWLRKLPGSNVVVCVAFVGFEEMKADWTSSLAR